MQHPQVLVTCLLSPVADESRDIGALAGQEMESRLADSVGGLRRGLAQV
jgi:hypothetical protein